MTTGRNDPCPCGSGKKYKRCCLEVDRAAASARLRDDAVSTKLADVQSPGFSLDAPTPADADRWLGDEADARPVELDGLSLAQYARLLHYEPTVDGLALVDGGPDPDSAAWAEGLVQLAPRLEREPEGEAAFLLRALLEAVPGGRAIALTRSTLLPRASVRSIARAHAAAFPDSLHGAGGPIAVETDFEALHTVRLAAEDAGLLEVDDGVIAQTPFALASCERCGLREAFPRLLRAYATVLDWGYIDDGLPDAQSVQDAWLLALRLVRRHGGGQDGREGGEGGEGIDALQLARALTAASAEAVHEVIAATNAADADPEAGYDGSVDEAVGLTATAFLWRSIAGFAELFGLATLTEVDGGPRLGPDGALRLDGLRVRSTAQLEDAVRFDPALLDGPAVLLAGALPEEIADVGAEEHHGHGGGSVEPFGESPSGPAAPSGDDGGRAVADDDVADDGRRRRRSARAASAAERRRRRR